MEDIPTFNTRQAISGLARNFAQNVQIGQQGQPQNLARDPNQNANYNQGGQQQVVGGQAQVNQAGGNINQAGGYNLPQGGNPERYLAQNADFGNQNFNPNPVNFGQIQQRPQPLNPTPNQRPQNSYGRVDYVEEEKKTNVVIPGRDNDEPWYGFTGYGAQPRGADAPTNRNQRNNRPQVSANQRNIPNLGLQTVRTTAEEDFDFEQHAETEGGPGDHDFDEKQLHIGLNPQGARNTKVSAQPLRTSKKLSEHNMTRQLMSSGPQSYVRRSDNSIQPLRQLEYIENIGNAPVNEVGFSAAAAFRIWAPYGGAMGGVKPDRFFRYITRPGVRPTDYMILDLRGEGGATRLNNLPQAIDRVSVIPYPESKGAGSFTQEEYRALSEGRAPNTADPECDVIAPEVMQRIRESRVKYIIVHCAQGANRSPVVAMALSAYLRRIGSDKKVLLLLGGSDHFWAFARNPQAQREYFEQEERERMAQALAPEQIALAQEAVLLENPNIIVLPSSPDLLRGERVGTQSTMPGTNPMLESNFNVSPTYEALTIQYARQHGGTSNIPMEEADRPETMYRDGAEFLDFFRDDPAPEKNNTCQPSGRGPDSGGPGGPGGGMGGGMGGNMFTKRSMDPLDIAGGRLRKRSVGLFMPESTGKGLRVVRRS